MKELFYYLNSLQVCKIISVKKRLNFNFLYLSLGRCVLKHPLDTKEIVLCKNKFCFFLFAVSFLLFLSHQLYHLLLVLLCKNHRTAFPMIDVSAHAIISPPTFTERTSTLTSSLTSCSGRVDYWFNHLSSGWISSKRLIIDFNAQPGRPEITVMIEPVTIWLTGA